MTELSVAIVTGGASGIGAEVATELFARGDAVLILDRDGDAAEARARDLDPSGERAAAARADVTDEASVVAAVDAAVAKWGRVDSLVHAAGIGGEEIVERMSLEDWNRVIGVNLTGAFLVGKSVLPRMRASGGGSIVMVGSIAAKRISYNGNAAYTAAKSGVLGFVRHFAFEAAPDRVRVNAICPGPTETPLFDQLAPEVKAARLASVPLGRLARPSDIAQAALYLTSPGSAMVTGQALDVDGGALLGWYDTDTYFERRGGKP